jgi:hypothetical protein
MGGDASGGSVKGEHALINIGSGQSCSQPISRFRLSFTIKGTAVTAVMPARGLLMPAALERRHILVQVERLPEGTLTAVRSSVSGPVRRPIPVFPRKASMAKNIVITMGLSMFGLVRFSDIMWLRRVGNSKNRKRRRWRQCPVRKRICLWIWGLCALWPRWRCIWRVSDRRTAWQGREARYANHSL